MRAASSVLALLVVAAGAPSVAGADPKSAADKTFERGRQLMMKKQYAEACAAFERSQELDPQLGTLFNLADCEAQMGKVATAWKIYRDLVASDSNVDRKRLSAESVAMLEPKLPRVVVAIATRPRKLKVRIDGEDATASVGVATPVDPGPHTVTASAPGYRDWTGSAEPNAGHTETVNIELEALETIAAPPERETEKVDAVAPSAAPGHGRAGKLVVLGGAVITGAGLGVGALAFSKWNTEQDCATCTGADKRSQAHDARVLGDVSTAVVAVGLVAVGAGIYLWHSSSSAAIVAPRIGPEQAGAMIVGRF